MSGFGWRWGTSSGLEGLSPVPPPAAAAVQIDAFADRLGCFVFDRIPAAHRVPQRTETECDGETVITLAWAGNIEQAVTLRIVIGGVTELPEVVDDTMEIRVADRETAAYFIGCVMEAVQGIAPKS